MRREATTHAGSDRELAKGFANTRGRPWATLRRTVYHAKQCSDAQPCAVAPVRGRPLRPRRESAAFRPLRQRAAVAPLPLVVRLPIRVTVPVKVSLPSPFASSTPVIRPPPLSPSKLPRPLTTSQSLRCFTSGGVEVKVIVRVPPEHRNILVTKSVSGSFLSPNRPPAQKAESPMVDPERTSPVVSPLALGGARCVLIRIGSSLPAVVPPKS